MNILFDFKWSDYNGNYSVNDVIKMWLKSKGYSFHYDKHFRLCAVINGITGRFDYTGGEAGGVVEFVAIETQSAE